MAIRRGVVRGAMKGRGPHAWRAAFLASLLVVGVADAVVLALTKAYFGSGYNGFALHGWSERAGFFALGAVLDATFLAGAWCVALGAARLLRARPLRAIAAATALGVALPIAYDLAMHRLHRVLGDVLELGVLLNLAGGSWGSALGEAAQDLPPTVLLMVGALAALAVGAFGVARLELRFPSLAAARTPRGGRLAAAFSAGCIGSAALLGWSAAHQPAIEFGLALKPAGGVVSWLVALATDVDRDGYGVLSRPPDPAPFDAAVHPYALEVPGNGVDEDGWAGDLPRGYEPPQPLPVRAPVRRNGSPSIVLIFLESFRADVVGNRLNDIPVTPNLDRLAGAGSSGVAYAHTPVTWASRASLVQGRVVATADGSTLVDDFLARGYEVAWFSGQDDRVSPNAARLGTERATHFYDARSDVALRTSRSAQPISLQVSWKTLVGRISEYLAHRESAKPLLLYVNIVDTHFPYWHRELDDVLAVGELARGAIRPENRHRVWHSYLNAVANVDRAIGSILATADERLGGETLVLVTADHGQAFYEAGFLGHGQAIDDLQTRVPLIARGIDVRTRSMLALSDVRGILTAALNAEPVVLPPGRPLLQWVGDVAEPRVIGLRRPDALVRVDVRLSTPRGEAQDDAIRSWEAARLQAIAPK